MIERVPAGALEKEAFFGQLLERVTNWFRPEATRAKYQLKEHLESKDPEKWDDYVAHAASSPAFIEQLKKSKKVSDKDVLHAVSMAGMTNGPTIGQVESDSIPGVQYQIRKLPSGDFACTCGDWRYKGSVNPGYACKHIRAFREGKSKVATIMEKNASFRAKTMAYFDELRDQRHHNRVDAERGMRDNYADPDSPFPNTLTQDEEPAPYNPNPPQSIEDPEIILGGNG